MYIYIFLSFSYYYTIRKPLSIFNMALLALMLLVARATAASKVDVGAAELWVLPVLHAIAYASTQSFKTRNDNEGSLSFEVYSSMNYSTWFRTLWVLGLGSLG